MKEKKGFSVIKIFEVLVLYIFAKVSESEVTQFFEDLLCSTNNRTS